ncbi:MAG: nucleotidyltransferase domain-containing protein [Thermoplasmata archaeon]
MRLKDGLDPLLGSPTKLRLLRKLLATPGRRWTGRELAAAARVSTAQAARDLDDFLQVGILLRDVQGRSYAWSVNEGHVLAPTLSQLFHAEASLRDALARDVGGLLAGVPVRRARLFGSVARGDERADSDVDLFVQVGTADERASVDSALEKIRDRVWIRFGNPLAALVYTDAETRHPRNPSLLGAIDREGVEVTPGGAGGAD